METALIIASLFGVISLILRNKKQPEPVKIPVRKEKTYKSQN